ncbi:MAG: serine/threonine-protein kinase [Planctomycetota bacterium]
MTGDAEADTPEEDEAPETRAAVLAAVQAALESGGKPDPAVLASLFPGHERTVARYCEAGRRLCEMREVLAAERCAWRRPRPGERIGDFVLEEVLGEGGMGVVHRARQVSLGDRAVALKLLPLGGQTAARRERFRKEARAASSLSHPHLAAVHAFGEEGDLLYYAMRLVEGPTLHAVLERLAVREGAADAVRLRRLVVERIAEVADALALAHARGLVHRDVKPSNILLDGQGSTLEELLNRPAVLVDFGLAHETNGDWRTYSLVAGLTPAYASPEQRRGESVDSRSDVFALGATLHDLLAARPPDQRKPAATGLEPLREVVPGIDRDLAAIVAKAADPDPRWRYAGVGELRDDLRAWMEGRPVAARRLHPIEGAWRAIRRNPARAARRGGCSSSCSPCPSWPAVGGARCTGCAPTGRRGICSSSTNPSSSFRASGGPPYSCPPSCAIWWRNWSRKPTPAPPWSTATSAWAKSRRPSSISAGAWRMRSGPTGVAIRPWRIRTTGGSSSGSSRRGTIVGPWPSGSSVEVTV